jgi:mono/diheme cytochrome c family protein
LSGPQEVANASHKNLFQKERYEGTIQQRILKIRGATGALAAFDWEECVRKLAACVGLLVVVVMAAISGCEKKPAPTDYKISAADSSKTNPLGVDAATVASGKKLYHGSDCAICHGREGDGKGVLAKDISLNIHNWKDLGIQKQFSDGDLFYILKNGKNMMPGYSKEETDDHIWQIVSFIRSLGTAGSAPTAP